jgi:hypothetical protein
MTLSSSDNLLLLRHTLKIKIDELQTSENVGPFLETIYCYAHNLHKFE